VRVRCAALQSLHAAHEGAQQQLAVRGFFAELKRRNVFRVAAAYGVVAWLSIQVSDIVGPRLGLPDWTVTFVIVVAAVGFPIALVLAWAYELTPDGVRAESSVAPRAGPGEGRRIDRVILLGLSLVVVLLVVDRFWLSRDVSPPIVQSDAETATAEKRFASEQANGEDRSLVVLPFANLSEDRDNEYFTDGLSEELMNVLAQAPTLRVIGRTSSFAWKGRNEDLRTIGAQLGVAHILEGSVRRQGDRVRVTTQLIRAADGSHMWSQTYDRTLSDVFAIQDDIAANVLQALEIMLDDAQRARMQSAGVRDVGAFVAYQKGFEVWTRAHQRNSVAEMLVDAHAQFVDATQRVPNFGAAYFLDADYYIHRLAAKSGFLDKQQQIDAYGELQRSLSAAFDSWQRQPLPRAITDVERVLFSEDWSPLREKIEQALALPGCARTLLFEQAMVMGYAEPLVELYQREVRCDPKSDGAWWDLAAASLWSGDNARTLRVVEQGVAAVGNVATLAAVRVYALLALGRVADATTAVAQVPADEDIYGVALHSSVPAAAGRIDDAIAEMNRTFGRLSPGAMDARMVVYAAVGDRARANAAAAELDARPGGPALITILINLCACGLPFDMSATPNLRARVDEAGIPWPPPTLIRYPAKDW